mgnify:FL=1
MGAESASSRPRRRARTGDQAKKNPGRKPREAITVNQDDYELLRGIDLSPKALPSVAERIDIATLGVMLDSGLQNLKNTSLATIAKLANTTDSSLYRIYPKGANQIVDSAIEWSFGALNTGAMRWAYSHPAATWDADGARIDGFPAEQTSSMAAVMKIQEDFRAVLVRMVEDPKAKLAVTSALLSLRRGAAMGGQSGEQQDEFRQRFRSLAAAHLGVQSDDPNAASLATWLANYLAAAWFTWLADNHRSDQHYLFDTDFVMTGLNTQMATAYQAHQAGRTTTRE